MICRAARAANHTRVSPQPISAGFDAHRSSAGRERLLAGKAQRSDHAGDLFRNAYLMFRDTRVRLRAQQPA